ncbi:hypothetical protein QBC47DRAFT_297137 [Echria macrotheca]|uniref:AAA+ ATPase domain-containing protein n=1 Tax=Echria macrotheca TaxID=438768 RepID=A0AAJ0FCY9_9PEZI|nr:hypothetical protein QBC47DRAFT_297137 [Echria macrotheca]
MQRPTKPPTRPPLDRPQRPSDSPIPPFRPVTPPQKLEQVVVLLPDVRICRTWEEFINRFEDEHGLYAVEALMAGSEINKELVDEHELRRQHRDGVCYFDTAQNFFGAQPPTVRAHRTVKPWLQRIRIQSPSLLSIFEKVTGYVWSRKPHTFLRPFRYLIYYHDKFKEHLQRMEAEYHSSPPPSSKEEVERATALEHLRCYIKFANEQIVPPYHSFTRANFSESRRIRFDDLWYLFRPGELIYVPATSLKKHLERMIGSQAHAIGESRQETGAHGPAAQNSRAAKSRLSEHQKVWRLMSTDAVANPIAPINIDGDDFDNSDFILTCYYYDYDGSNYSTSSEDFCISYFDGEKEIKSLDFYPIRFAPAHEALLQECRSNGLKFTECIKRQHMAYSGWTMNTTPMGELVGLTREYMESEVMIDFQEAFNGRPWWKPFMVDEERWADFVGYENRIDAFALINWADQNRSRAVSWINEVIVLNDNTFRSEHDEIVRKDPFLNPQTRVGRIPTGDDLALLPRRLFGYGLRDRQWALLDVQNLNFIPYQRDAFDRLELNESHKTVIDAMVSSHFDKKRIEAYGEVSTQDIIVGKGGGLVIMLHGEPGVGKTATAEAVAQKHQKPLFNISCGDLGVAPDRVESSLSQIFHLAHLWDCVLLLDEADIFLTARGANSADLKRNGIVSAVFLRIMEYYKGILFLTTNRVGKLDPAINSRIHVTLHYKRFSEQDFRKIFMLNLDMLKAIEEQRYMANERIRQTERDSGLQPVERYDAMRLHVADTDIMAFASNHYRRHSNSRDTTPWNGRQVRNAFVVASALARKEGQRQQHPPQLRQCHFLEVERLTSDFDRFRANLMGGDDSHIARRLEERDDSWGDEEGDAATFPPIGYTRKRLSVMVQSSSQSTTLCGSSTATTPVSTRPPLHHLSVKHEPPRPSSPSSVSTLSKHSVAQTTKPPAERAFPRPSAQGYHTPQSSIGSPPSPSPFRSKYDESVGPAPAYSEVPGYFELGHTITPPSSL